MVARILAALTLAACGQPVCTATLICDGSSHWVPGAGDPEATALRECQLQAINYQILFGDCYDFTCRLVCTDGEEPDAR